VLNVPAAHAVQARSAWSEPGVLTAEPAAQFVHAEHEPAFEAMLNCPVAHAAHSRSFVAEPGALTYCPGMQAVQTLHAVVLELVLKVPVAQSAQVRSVVASPSLTTMLPATHMVLATHGVAALWSSSQVPASQAAAAAVPPAHQLPAWQGSQLGGEEAVPAALWTVPGSQAG
jgi:hypothetical protein